MRMNIDENEVAKFAKLADKWWDKDGDFKPLHKINPLRAKYIDDIAIVQNKTFLDVGCGGGILAEAIHDKGAKVTGIDAAGPGINAAKLHAKNESKDIRYIDFDLKKDLSHGSFRTGCYDYKEGQDILMIMINSPEFDKYLLKTAG